MLDAHVEYKPFLSEVSLKLSPAQVLKYLCTPTKSGKVCSPEMAMRFCMLCKARGLNPWEGDAYIVGYDSKDGPSFSLITAHQAFLKRAEVHPEYDGMESGAVLAKDGVLTDSQGDFIVPGWQLCGGWARIHFKNRKVPIYRRLNLGAFAKDFGVWKSNAAGMIVKCAEADALRSAFPNSLGGMYLDDEMDRTPAVESKTSTPMPVGSIDLRKSAPDRPAAVPDVEPVPENKAEPAKAEPAPANLDGDPDPNSPEDRATMAQWAAGKD